jgi:hypothetical protein
MLSEGDDKPKNLPADDEDAAIWAAREIRRISGDNPLLAKEEDCKVKVVTADFEEIAEGTLDVIDPDARMSYDIKTGQIYNYKEQMAAYALGCMDRFNTDKWECVLVFADQKELVHYEFLYEEAEAIVLKLWERWNDRENEEPEACQYCNWCAKGIQGDASCPAVVKQLKQVETLAQLPSNIERCKELLLSDAVAAGQFLRAMKLLKELEDAVKKTSYDSGGSYVPAGYKLQKRKGSEKVNTAMLDIVAKSVGTMKLISCATWNAKKVKELCELYNLSIDGLIVTTDESTALVEMK